MRRITPILIALALVLTACTGDTTGSTPSTTEPDGPGPSVVRPTQPITGVLASQSLVAFDECDAFLDYVIEHALELVGPYGLPGGGYGYPVPMPGIAFLEGDVAVDGEMAPAPTPAAQPGPVEEPRAGVDFSGTNVQELGVDEPDIVKTDGNRIVVLSQQTLFVVDVTGDSPALLGKTTIPDLSVRDLLLVGDRVLALGGGYGSYYRGGIVPDGSYQTPISKIVEIDISSQPRVVRTLEFDGSYISARLVGDSARIVVTSSPIGFVWQYPEGGGLKAERDATEKNREIIENSTIDNWVPYFVLSNASGDVIDEGAMVDCDRARHPGEFAGLDLLSVMSIDMSRGLRVADATGVLATGQTVYASTGNLYVATQRWFDWVAFQADPENADFDGVTTQIHQFDISDPDRTEYVASGSIEGFLLNQFAMSEYDGYLRVASTTEPDWRRWGDSEQESMVTVLRAVDGELATVGRVDGLGRGERIYSVRFIDDTAYVVTFRQTDPLYTVDLSDPAAPEVVGELKILGYSAYLHPLGDDLLLGVGQDADEQGRIEGTQVSIFDVSDPANPERIAKLTLAKDSNSSVEYDHRAFLYWAPSDLAVIPVQRWSWHEREGKEEVFFGAIGIDVGNGDIREIGTVVHPGGASTEGVWDWMAQIQRSLVIGDDLYTVSMKGLLRSDLSTLDDEVFLDFGTATVTPEG